jgi:hypothetical protein
MIVNGHFGSASYGRLHTNPGKERMVISTWPAGIIDYSHNLAK